MKIFQSKKTGLSRRILVISALALPFFYQCTKDDSLAIQPERPATTTEFAAAKSDTQVAMIKLEASEPYITANGKDTVELRPVALNKHGIRVDTAGFEIFHNDKKIDAQNFVTFDVGKHAFVARLGQYASEPVTVEALKDSNADLSVARIEVTASTQVLVANGKSTTTFEVACFTTDGRAIGTQEGEKIYVNGKALQGSQFTTTTAGDHRVVAKVGDITSNEIIITARPDKAYEIVTIPVVFHIGHFGEAAGTGANIPASMVQDLLDALNRGYGNQFGSTNPNAVDMRVRFRLAQTDAAGKPLAEKGIVRTNVTKYDTGLGNNTAGNSQLGLTEWRAWQDEEYLDPKSFYNIWLYPAEESWAGLANYPSISLNNPLAGITGFEPGRRSYYVNTEFNFPAPRINTKHRAGITTTLVHEVGHTFGLRHTFSDNNCATTDYCEDTYSYNYPNVNDACADNKGSKTPNENFMDYNGSRNTFTYDQRERVRHTIQHALWFPELIKSKK